ncbi:MAG: dehydrogenase E1 component subunit alpha/beta [Verrucomicrobiota bacterium]|nr:dehydrogenase E1 component subunit alpha/beta [Verrucomicrobiota bacterium]
MPNYLSDRRPDFRPRLIECGSIPAYSYKKNLKSELAGGTLTRPQAVEMLEDMLTIREFEEMIIKLRSGAYEPFNNGPCKGFNYRGPTHLSIGQEAASVGSCMGIAPDDFITSTHRGHGDSIAKGCVAIRAMTPEQLKARAPARGAKKREEWVDAALEDHVYRTIAELFGKEDGYCKGRGGGMHIADFTIGHLGANAIVGGGVPIATGAALAARCFRNDKIVCCFAGDGAYGNGVVLESLNWAAMSQFTNVIAKDRKFGLPVIFLALNNHYGMTGRADDEVTGIERLARRAAGFADNNMRAEVVNGMSVLAARDAVLRAAAGCRAGKGPYFIEADTYRHYGHSLTDPRNEYRTREEETAWKAVDPIDAFTRELLTCNVLTEKKVEELKKKVRDRNARAAIAAAQSADPNPEDVIKYMYTDTAADVVPEAFRKAKIVKKAPEIKRTDDGQLTYKDAIKEALFEEMMRDTRVVLYGEDVADYGGAFKVTKGLLEAFGRERVFNAPISEAAICGTAVGAAMVGLRPVVELMYMDFALMASDQISNQAAKWHYMSGAKAEVPLVYRTSVGGGKGYGGQHSQTLESVFAHIPGLYVVYLSTPCDAKGMLKAAIRDNNPVMFVESQLLYGVKGSVPKEDYLVPLGVADVKRQGKDLTIVAWGPAVWDALKAADLLQKEKSASAEVVDVRSLVPLDIRTIVESVRKTGRCIVVSQSVDIGSFTGEIVSRVVAEAFDYLDAPVLKVGARNGIAPQSHILEAAFLPNANDIVAAAMGIL